MYVNQWPWPDSGMVPRWLRAISMAEEGWRATALRGILRTCGAMGDGRGALPRGKSKGCSQKTSGRSYSLKHPVARHFVCSLLLQQACHSQVIEKARRMVFPER